MIATLWIERILRTERRTLRTRNRILRTERRILRTPYIADRGDGLDTEGCRNPLKLFKTYLKLIKTRLPVDNLPMCDRKGFHFSFLRGSGSLPSWTPEKGGAAPSSLPRTRREAEGHVRLALRLSGHGSSGLECFGLPVPSTCQDGFHFVGPPSFS